jgi:hypothetical protein
VKVVETQQAEKAAENVHHRAAWRDAPKIHNRNRVRRDMPLRNSFQLSQLLSAGLRARTRVGPTPAQGNRAPTTRSRRTFAPYERAPDRP